MSAIAHKSEVIDTYGLTDSAKLAFPLFRAKERLAPSGTGPGLVRFSGWNFERKEPIDGSAKSPGDPAATAVAMLATLYAAADYVILNPFLRQEHLNAQERWS